MMNLNPATRDKLYWVGGILVAVVAGYKLANGQYLLPALLLMAAGAVIMSLLRTTTLQVVIIAGLLIGYIVGNRGFAQFMLIPGLPLLPGEMGLALLLVLQLIERATARGPSRRLGAFEVVLGAWIAVGVVRFALDVRVYGLVAARDFAMVYYAVFFYVARNLALNHPASGEALLTVIRRATLVLLVTHRLWGWFPDVFLNLLQVGGIPLIFYKTDLAGMFLAAGAVLQYLRFEERGGWWRWGLIGLMALEVLATNNRASMLGMVMGFFWMMAGGRWRIGVLGGASAALGIVGILWIARFTNTPWQETPVYGLYEKTVSIIDPSGARSYGGTDTFNKGDNNRYRTVWWGLVYRDTVETNPWGGLGFGYDLTKEFMRTYYGLGREYAVRSPHSIVVTIFARMGLAGLVPFLVLLGLLTAATFQAVQGEPSSRQGFWLVAWVILVTSCFGVVMEGPMGAIVFWLVVGMARGLTLEAEAETETENEAVDPKSLTDAGEA